MGKRKSRAKPVQKRIEQKVPTVFDCPFCNHEHSVECKIDSKHCIATISCRVCGANFQMNTTSLTAAVDVYAEWIDRCEEEKRRELEDDFNEAEEGVRNDEDEAEDDRYGYYEGDDYE